MRHRDYLRRLRRTAREHGLVADDGPEYAREPTLPEEQAYLVHVMRQTGFSEEQVAEKRAEWAREGEG